MDFEDEQRSSSEDELSPQSHDEVKAIIRQHYEITNNLSKKFLINIFMNSYVLSEKYKQSSSFQDIFADVAFNDGQDNILKIKKEENYYETMKLDDDMQLNMMKQIKVISSIFTKQTTKQLAPTLTITNLTPGDHIFYSGEADKQNLYYIHEGQVQLLEDNSQKCIQTLNQGETFGEYSFFTGFPTKTSAKCLSFVQLVKIERTHFIQLVSEVRRDWEKFHHIKDKISLESNYAAIYLNCSICKKYNHCNIDCPLLTYQPDLEQRIKKATIDFGQKRSKLFRQKQKINALQISKQVAQQRDILNQNQLSLKENEIQFSKIEGNAIDSQQEQIQQFTDSVNIDKVQQYDEYMKENNFDNCIKLMLKGMQARPKEDLKILKEISQYTFKSIVQERTLRMSKNYYKQWEFSIKISIKIFL